MRVFRKMEIEVENYQVGDQIIVPLRGIGGFTATVQKVTDESALFLFDECVARKAMNENGENRGGYEESDLKKWIDTTLYMSFPEEMRDKMYGLTIPTVGQIVGLEGEWNNENLEMDNEEQFPLMNERKNRITCFKGQIMGVWLRNAAEERYSSGYFACMDGFGSKSSLHASLTFGVRPEFWIKKGE